MSYRYNGWRNNGCNWGLLSTDTLVCCNKSGMGNVVDRRQHTSTSTWEIVVVHISRIIYRRYWLLLCFTMCYASYRLHLMCLTTTTRRHPSTKYWVSVGKSPHGKCMKAGSSSSLHAISENVSLPLTKHTQQCAMLWPPLHPPSKFFRQTTETNNLRILARDRHHIKPFHHNHCHTCHSSISTLCFVVIYVVINAMVGCHDCLTIVKFHVVDIVVVVTILQFKASQRITLCHVFIQPTVIISSVQRKSFPISFIPVNHSAIG